MRLGNIPACELADRLSSVDCDVRDTYLRHMTRLVSGTPLKVMLGDTTVMDQTTFDTKTIVSYMECIVSELGNGRWSARNVTETRDDDVRRIFVKFESESRGYRVSVHLSVQFRALLYYRPDARVAQIQKELAEIDDAATEDRDEIARRGDKIISERLGEMGYGDLDHAKLFETLYDDASLSEHMSDLIKKSADDAGLARMVDRRSGLFDELDSLLMEVYSTTAIMIDDARLVTGEDGFLYTVDIERVAGAGGGRREDGGHDAPDIGASGDNSPAGAAGPAADRAGSPPSTTGRAEAWEGSFDVGTIPDESKEFLASCLEDLVRAVRSAGRSILKESE